ncbi:Slp family lipoprotein [Aliiglaciecola lipolytica]|uniref:Starvation-inducible outer membrane lipoprotein n=1 Tax=Aliiglaciecola lipolytica E3 TaxID=1127673 RepID=K6Y5Q2_9ALTE|nr:Slp family lipoprotein [Aliiglaciecola lipolytica]GAC13567.1 starvation-inducible outer membrane lipoprotein [Aliiglaciecola lipolytica E3]
MLAKIAVFFSVALMAGCSTIPDSIKVEDNVTLVEYQKVTANPEANVGKTVRWGGVIANVLNLPDATMVEMVDFPLRSYARPLVSNQSMGRFRVYIDGFIDPVLFEKGRSVTFTGEVTGMESGLVGEHQYLFPTIQSSGYHLWKEVDRVDVTNLGMWPYTSSYWGWPYRPYHQRVIIRRHSDSPSGGSLTPNRGSQSNRHNNNSSPRRNNSVKTVDKEP